MKPLFAPGSGFLTRSSTHSRDRGILVSMDPIDKAAIFESLCRRNQLRREARLPLLDLKAEYDHSVIIAEAARRRAMRQQYEPEVRNEIITRMREQHGPHWGKDLGGRYWLGELVRRTIAARYGV